MPLRDYRARYWSWVYIAFLFTLPAFVYFGVQGDLGISFTFSNFAAHKPKSIANSAQTNSEIAK